MHMRNPERSDYVVFGAARAEIELGFADQRLVAWVGIVSETTRPSKVR